jgi:hypothetical protein
MGMKTKRELTAPCGLDCFNCEVYEKNITEQTKKLLAERLQLPTFRVACKGCREQKGIRLRFSSCETFDCVIKKGKEFCFECEEFPCAKLQPAVEGAGLYPHNMKLFNLCRMKLVGVDKWAEEEAAEIRKKYFKGKFIVGVGPVLK